MTLVVLVLAGMGTTSLKVLSSNPYFRSLAYYYKYFQQDVYPTCPFITQQQTKEALLMFIQTLARYDKDIEIHPQRSVVIGPVAPRESMSCHTLHNPLQPYLNIAGKDCMWEKS